MQTGSPGFHVESPAFQLGTLTALATGQLTVQPMAHGLRCSALELLSEAFPMEA